MGYSHLADFYLFWAVAAMIWLIAVWIDFSHH